MSAPEGEFGQFTFPAFFLSFVPPKPRPKNSAGLVVLTAANGDQIVEFFRTHQEAAAYRDARPELSHYELAMVGDHRALLKLLGVLTRRGVTHVAVHESDTGVRPIPIPAVRSAVLRQVGGDG